MAAKRHRHHRRSNPTAFGGHTTHRRHRRHNPEVFGEDALGLVVTGLGLGVTDFVNEHAVKPLVRKFITVQDGTIMAKGLDVVTTAGSAVLAGECIGFVSKRYGKDIKQGGMIYAGGKGAVALIGGDIKASLSPNISGLLGRVTPPAPAPTPALNAGQTPNYPKPASPSMNVGI